MENINLIKILSNCIASCNHCADACLDEDNIPMMVDCIRTDRACAEICRTTMYLLSSNYKDIQDMIAYCYKTCMKCAEECERHSMAHCQQCAKACRECASACKAYLN